MSQLSRECGTMRPSILFVFAACVCSSVRSHPSRFKFPFQNPALPVDERVEDLLGRLSLEEKIGQTFSNATMAFNNNTYAGQNGDQPSTNVSSLGVPMYNYMGQGSVYRGASNGCNINCCSGNVPPGNCTNIDGVATVLPQGTGWAASWNTELTFRAGQAIADESLAIQYHFPGSVSKTVDYRTGASAVINLVRDGRWGRVPETYGECTHLTAELATALNRALMGFDADQPFSDALPRNGKIKVSPTLRHFAAYTGPERLRFGFNAIIPDTDLRYTWLPVWERLIKRHAVGSVMSAISGLNGAPMAAQRSLLTGVLRDEWKYQGYVISDCDTLPSVVTKYHFASNIEEAAALALEAGGDVNCGPEYATLGAALSHGLLAESTLDTSVRRLLRNRILTGDLDPTHPYSNISYSVVDSQPHRDLADQLSREAVVLLKKGPGFPLKVDQGRLKTLAVIGPSADDPHVQAHTYHGTPSRWLTLLASLKALLPSSVTIKTAPGCARHGSNTSGFAAALAVARSADAVIYVGGLDQGDEEEDTDRDDFLLPGVQAELIKQLAAALRAEGGAGSLSGGTAVPFGVVLYSGGPLAEPTLLAEDSGVDSVFWSSYSGQTCVGMAEVLLGSFAPCGALPFTVPLNTSQVADIASYTMSAGFGRTYRYLNLTAAPPLRPFGFALHYTDFKLSDMVVSPARIALAPPGKATKVTVTASVHNVGTVDSMFVVQLYMRFGNDTVLPPSPLPKRQLVAFTKPFIKAGASASVSLEFDLDEVPSLRAQPRVNMPIWIGNSDESQALLVGALQFN